MMELYDEISVGYRNSRRPDPRIATAIFHALGEVDTVVNVGAGAGSYEPSDRSVIAVEPSMTIIRQRPVGSAPAVQASATHLPFRSATFEAALAILTVHHWPDRARGLGELARVARDRIVILTWDPATSGFWLVDDYFPEIVEIDRPIFPSIEELSRALGRVDVHTLPIPPRLRGRLPRGLLVAAACLSGRERPQRNFDVLQDPRPRSRADPAPSRFAGRNLGASIRRSPRAAGD